jgi:glucose/arabinose dehydrogenase/cytochrome c553
MSELPVRRIVGWILVAAASAAILVIWYHQRSTLSPVDAGSKAANTAARAEPLPSPPTTNVDDPLDEDAVTLAPGLAAVYRSVDAADSGLAVERIDPKPAFTWRESSPDPLISPGPFVATWTGVLLFRETAPVRFGAFASGDLRVVVGNTVVLDGHGDSETSWIDGQDSLRRENGAYRIAIEYRSLASVPARVQLWWESTSFAREPLPAWRLRHVPSELPQGFRELAVTQQGRAAVLSYGCGRCHREAFPLSDAAVPGPSLSDIRDRIEPEWLTRWLADPRQARSDAHMPKLFADDRTGFVERWVVSRHLLGRDADRPPLERGASRDFRPGKQSFIGLGCAACHPVPDPEFASQPESGRHRLEGLGDRFTEARLADFLANPHARYPDDRMPSFSLKPQEARDIAAFLLRASPASPASEATPPPPDEEVLTLAKSYGVENVQQLGAELVNRKGCRRCHDGLGETITAAIPVRQSVSRNRIVTGGEPESAEQAGQGADEGAAVAGCLSSEPAPSASPRFRIDEPTRRTIQSYMRIAGKEHYDSGFHVRQRKLARAGCSRCHQRDGEGPSAIDEIGRSLWTPFLYRLPYQRTPRLTNAIERYRHDFLVSAVNRGVSGVRPTWYSYRMPSYGTGADVLVQAIAESDGALIVEGSANAPPVSDPTLRGVGPSLAGFDGYACVKCHLWNGQSLAEADPGSVGPELTSVTQRIRREWFDRWLEDPQRMHPGTPMPSIFRRNQPAAVSTILGGDAMAQRDALWSYLEQGKDAPSPRSKPPIPIAANPGIPPIVAQIPIQEPGKPFLESISLLFSTSDLIVFDVASLAISDMYTDARILRHAGGLGRTYSVAGRKVLANSGEDATIHLSRSDQRVASREGSFMAFDRLSDGARLHYELQFEAGTIQVSETIRQLEQQPRRVQRQFQISKVPAGYRVEIPLALSAPDAPEPLVIFPEPDSAAPELLAGNRVAFLAPDSNGKSHAGYYYELPPPRVPNEAESPLATSARPAPSDDPAYTEGFLERPGYRAIRYELPQLDSGECRIMPGAITADPRTGRVFVASLKLGELLAIDDSAQGSGEQLVDYAHGLFQDALSMTHDGEALYVLHRRNLTRVVDTDGDRIADRFERVAAFSHGIANMYDWGYGLVREPSGSFILSLAPHANQQLPGAGTVLRLTPGAGATSQQELAFGLRNPLGWCAGPEGEVFFTDNQGEWVATNKLCHVQPGRYYGYPNPAKPDQSKAPMAQTAVWVPYAWAKSINGVAYDTTGGRFGPFAGQFFLAELMYGGGIVRADVEKVNGVFQGVCFPFWGKGLLGPLVLAFTPNGHLFVGSITQPGWMGQPDRGALYRIETTGEVPFEIQTIRVQPHGFRIVFTAPVDAASATAADAYSIESYRYEYTQNYGSPELDRRPLAIESIRLASDRRSVDITTDPLHAGRVYSITATRVRSASGDVLVHPTGAYTLNEIPE